MRHLRTAVVAFIALPVVVSAQARGGRGMGGSKDADWNSIAQKGPTGPSISGKDFDNANPYKALLEKKKDLKLTDAQVAALKDSDAKLRDGNGPLYKAVDSLRKEMKPRTTGEPSAEDQARMVLSREALMNTVREIRTSFDAAIKTVMPTLDESQQKTASEVLAKNDEELQQTVREKLGGGRGMGGGPGGGRGRPPA